jgi:hypothetical protein
VKEIRIAVLFLGAMFLLIWLTLGPPNKGETCQEFVDRVWRPEISPALTGPDATRMAECAHGAKDR